MPLFENSISLETDVAVTAKTIQQTSDGDRKSCIFYILCFAGQSFSSHLQAIVGFPEASVPGASNKLGE